MNRRLDGPLGFALRAAGAAARQILRVYAEEFRVEDKEDRTPITEADRHAHRAIEAELSAGLGYPVLSEEGLHLSFAERRRWRAFWLVDPLDGTKEFIRRNGEFTVNIALIERRRPVLGVVYAPALRLLYFAHPGIGAFTAEGIDPEALLQAGREIGADGLPLPRARRLPPRPSTFPGRIPGRPRSSRITVMRSRSHHSARWQQFIEQLRRVYAEVEVISLGSALKSCYVAEGRADLYLRFGTTMEWDTAAAHAVVEAVGRRMCAYPGRRALRYNKPDLTNPAFLVF